MTWYPHQAQILKIMFVCLFVFLDLELPVWTLYLT